MQRQNSNKEMLRRSTSKTRDNPKIQQSPVITTSKLPSKPNPNPYSSKNTFEILNKMNDNYKDIKEVNIAFNDNKAKVKQVKNPIEFRPSTPQNKKTPVVKTKKPEIRKRFYTREKAAVVIQRTFRKYIRVRWF
jgi:hypothetical protein